jgi:hypothetical protein
LEKFHMKKILFLLVFLAFAGLYAQEDAWVYFTDKPDAETYLANPLSMLTQRALDRRAAQGIALDEKDVPVSQAYIDQVAASVTVMAKSKWLNALHVRGSQPDIQQLTALPFVDHVTFADQSLNSGKPRPHRAPSTAKTLETDVVFQYGGSANQIQMLNGELLHQQNFTGQGKYIAVLDAGFPGVDVVQPFQRLRDNGQILGGYNFVDRSENFYTRNYHGTMVLSTMGGYVPGQLVGTAPDASYYLFITEDTDSENPVEESLWVEAAEEADRLGVDVINTSLGYFGYDDPSYSYTYDQMDGQTSFIARGADVAFSRGMVVVVSAGNSGDTTDPHIGTPADALNVLSVGAVDASGVHASFSSIGPSADGRVKPDVDAQGVADTVASPNGSVVTGSGTSFAGPVIAGMMATLWSAVPNLTNVQLVEAVKESASLWGAPTDQMGYGIPDFSFALDLAPLSVPKSTAGAFVVYPNPMMENVWVTLPSGVPAAHFELFNAVGQEVMDTTLTGNPVAVQQLPRGIYTYRLTTASASKAGKLIKQ